MQSILNFWSRPQMWSNLFYLLPGYVAVTRGYTLETILILITMMVSLIYHSFNREVSVEWFFLRNNVPTPEFIMGILDYLCGFSVGIFFAWRFLTTNTDAIVSALLILFFAFGLVIFMGPNYFPFLRRWSVSASHSLWHILSGLIMTMVLI